MKIIRKSVVIKELKYSKKIEM